jgi:hypothetical protein
LQQSIVLDSSGGFQHLDLNAMFRERVGILLRQSIILAVDAACGKTHLHWRRRCDKPHRQN